MLANLLSAVPYALAVAAMLLVSTSADRRGALRLHLSVFLGIAALALALAVAADGLVRLALISVATAATFSSLGPFWAIPSQFLGGRCRRDRLDQFCWKHRRISGPDCDG